MALRQDMLLAGCEEVNDERTTVVYIVCDTSNEDYRYRLRSSLAMLEDDKYPKTVDKIEIKMRNYMNFNPPQCSLVHDEKSWRFRTSKCHQSFPQNNRGSQAN